MSDVSKGFNVASGVILALLFVFGILPASACVGCVVLAGSGGAEDESVKVTKVGFKVVPNGTTLSDLAYTFTIVNTQDRAMTKDFNIKFMDEDGFLVTGDLLNATIPARTTRELSGSRRVMNNIAMSVTQMTAAEH